MASPTDNILPADEACDERRVANEVVRVQVSQFHLMMTAAIAFLREGHHLSTATATVLEATQPTTTATNKRANNNKGKGKQV